MIPSPPQGASLPTASYCSLRALTRPCLRLRTSPAIMQLPTTSNAAYRQPTMPLPLSTHTIPFSTTALSSTLMRIIPRPSWSLLHPTPAPRPYPSVLVPYEAQKRHYQNYFITHLPSSSLHPDSGGPHHKLPRSASTPHQGPMETPAAAPPNMPNRNLTVVRIPLRSAKHHFGVAVSRGTRMYNEDTNQAGTIDMPAFAKRAPISLVSSKNAMQRSGQGMTGDSAFGDPQIFYFAVFDGHGGTECSEFLREELHGYLEEAATEFSLRSSLRSRKLQTQLMEESQKVAEHRQRRIEEKARERAAKEEKASAHAAATPVKAKVVAGGIPHNPKASLSRMHDKMASITAKQDERKPDGAPKKGNGHGRALEVTPKPGEEDLPKGILLERSLCDEYRTIGGYFKRFRPAFFDLAPPADAAPATTCVPVTVESVLTYAFLRADLDFVMAQAQKPDPDDPYVSDFPLNEDEILGFPNHRPPSGHSIGGPHRFKGGSTASVVLVSTATPAPFWHPAVNASIMVAHVGDTRVIICQTATGLARPLTSDHHPSTPLESRRLTRFAESFVTDSFGDQRIGGTLANSRAFGDVGSKRLGVSAEPEITRVDMGPAEYSFIVLCSDGVSGTLGDQEIVDIVKESRTPEDASRAVVDFATEISKDGDNATCLVVRLGGWERRNEGGLGSLGTKEIREMRRSEAMDPRRRGHR